MSLPPLLLPNAVFIALLWRWLPLWNRALYRSWETPDVDRISVFGAVELAVNTLKAFQALGWFYGLPSKGLLNSFLHKDDLWWPPLHPWHFSIGIKMWFDDHSSRFWVFSRVQVSSEKSFKNLLKWFHRLLFFTHLTSIFGSLRLSWSWELGERSVDVQQASGCTL